MTSANTSILISSQLSSSMFLACTCLQASSRGPDDNTYWGGMSIANMLSCQEEARSEPSLDEDACTIVRESSPHAWLGEPLSTITHGYESETSGQSPLSFNRDCSSTSMCPSAMALHRSKDFDQLHQALADLLLVQASMLTMNIAWVSNKLHVLAVQCLVEASRQILSMCAYSSIDFIVSGGGLHRCERVGG